jgi:very-short-patch-repair endonuclease
MKSSSASALYHAHKLRAHAAEMRARHNAAEAALWEQLRAGQLGVWFRRQVSSALSMPT